MQALASRQAHETEKARRIIQRLTAAHPDCPASCVEAAVATARERLVAARVRMFVPIFIERFARETLDQPIGDRCLGRARRQETTDTG
jgi:hypothetical protein